MDQETLLLEYLKHHWSERSFHLDGELKVTAFLIGAAGVVLGLAFKEGVGSLNAFASGIVVFIIGLANLRINQAYFIGNRYRNSVAGRTRHALEKGNSSVDCRNSYRNKKSNSASRRSKT
jgi:hypothetical protein